MKGEDSVRFAGRLRGFNPHYMRTTFSLELVWGSALTPTTPQKRFQQQLDKMWGTKNFLLASLADYFCPNVSICDAADFVLIISVIVALNLVS